VSDPFFAFLRQSGPPSVDAPLREHTASSENSSALLQ